MSRIALVMGLQCLRDAYRRLLGTMCTTQTSVVNLLAGTGLCGGALAGPALCRREPDWCWAAGSAWRVGSVDRGVVEGAILPAAPQDAQPARRYGTQGGVLGGAAFAGFGVAGC